MSDDIVARLRDCTCVPHGELCREAADEIERLRKELDEARRIACEIEAAYNRMMFDSPDRNDPVEIMKRRGWNKEDNS